ncbi:RNA exonuclease 1 homolog [Pelecanus crispus]|uniref:RNA exonuclease 1 homolog n=1 Tax=Pelecanus crispus TaxID=36300 RepID=UPI003F5CFDFF
MRRARCPGASPCPSGRPVGGRGQRPRCPYRQEASRRGEPSAAGPSQGVSISSVTHEDKNVKQQRKPTEVFPCENQDGNSKMSAFRSRHVFTKRSRSSSPVKLDIKLDESDDECDLVIDVPPQAVNKKRRIRRNSTNRITDKELAAVIYAKRVHDSGIADIRGCTEEKSEKVVTLRKNGRELNKSEELGNVSSKANEIYLPDVNTDVLKVLEERDAFVYTEEKRLSSAASIETHMQKGTLKQGNAETNIWVKGFVQEHTANAVCVSSGRVTQSAFCTGHSSKDETTIERPYKEIINTEENRGNGSPEDTYPCPTYYLNKKESEITLLSSSTEKAEPSGEDTEFSESDDPLEECRRIFDEFEREAQKKDVDKQAYGGNVNLSETKISVPGQKRRIAHTAKFDVSTQERPFIPESGSKVPLETRQRYVRLFFTECFKICSTVNEAINKALIEEQSVYDRCGSKKMYLNLAVKTLKKLRDHGQLSASTSSGGTGCIKSEEEKGTGGALYELLKDYLLTEEQLNENNFPRTNPEKSGSAILTGVVKNAGYDAFKRVCCRCGEVYAVTSSGEYRRKEECNYHSGRVLEQKVPGGMEKCYSCCERTVGSAGCQIAKLHVHDGRREKLEGFMKTLIKSPPFDGNYGVYALDCETCYTTRGLELTRVTVVDAKLQVVYDTFVKPDGKVVDYDIRLSGATEADLKNTTTSLRDVQAVLLNLFSADTILIGHSLENALFALKLIHDTVVDTSIVFPHRLGLPHKRALRSLMADYLRRIRQDDVGGHNSREDAIACMELILWKIKEDNKGRKR